MVESLVWGTQVLFSDMRRQHGSEDGLNPCKAQFLVYAMLTAITQCRNVLFGTFVDESECHLTSQWLPQMKLPQNAKVNIRYGRITKANRFSQFTHFVASKTSSCNYVINCFFFSSSFFSVTTQQLFMSHSYAWMGLKQVTLNKNFRHKTLATGVKEV